MCRSIRLSRQNRARGGGTTYSIGLDPTHNILYILYIVYTYTSYTTSCIYVGFYGSILHIVSAFTLGLLHLVSVLYIVSAPLYPVISVLYIVVHVLFCVSPTDLQHLVSTSISYLDLVLCVYYIPISTISCISFLYYYYFYTISCSTSHIYPSPLPPTLSHSMYIPISLYLLLLHLVFNTTLPPPRPPSFQYCISYYQYAHMSLCKTPVSRPSLALVCVQLCRSTAEKREMRILGLLVYLYWHIPSSAVSKSIQYLVPLYFTLLLYLVV